MHKHLSGSRRGWTVALCVFIAALCGCVGGTDFKDTHAVVGSVVVDSVYIYSFVDIREGNAGADFLEDMRNDLNNGFWARGVRVKQLWFKESMTARTTSVAEVSQGYRQTAVTVPIAKTINENRDDDLAFAAKYRLIIVPSFVVGGNYTFKWTLLDARNNREVWSSESLSHRVVQYSVNEAHAERAKMLVDGIFAEMDKSGVVLSSLPLPAK